jgi:phage terminase small subunit
VSTRKAANRKDNMQGCAKNPESQKLTERQQRFVLAYADCGVAAEAYRRAGYNLVNPLQATSRACALVHKANIQAAINRLRNKRESEIAVQESITVEWLRAEHMRLAGVAEGVGDLTNATRNLEGIGRTLGAYSDNLTVDTAAIRRFSESERGEADRLAQLLIDSRLQLPTIREAVVLPSPTVEQVRANEEACKALEERSRASGVHRPVCVVHNEPRVTADDLMNGPDPSPAGAGEGTAYPQGVGCQIKLVSPRDK